jgi:hypothetical protein
VRTAGRWRLQGSACCGDIVKDGDHRFDTRHPEHLFHEGLRAQERHPPAALPERPSVGQQGAYPDGGEERNLGQIDEYAGCLGGGQGTQPMIDSFHPGTIQPTGQIDPVYAIRQLLHVQIHRLHSVARIHAFASFAE